MRPARERLAVVLLGGALASLPAPSWASSAHRPAVSAAADSEIAATHATRGVVKAIDTGTLVITRFANRGEMTFALLPSTHREGRIGVGSTVSVRYREAGNQHIATAVALQRARD